MFQVGDKVTKGQVVCIVEAMKLMNEIEVMTGTVNMMFWFLLFDVVRPLVWVEQSLVSVSCEAQLLGDIGETQVL